MITAVLLYLAVGACAGLLAGLLGIGGGLVIVAVLAWLLPTQGVPVDLAMHAALGTSLATIVLTGLASARAHHRRGSVLWPSVRVLVPGLLIGGAAGALLATRLPGDVLRYGVATFCLLAAVQLAFGQPRGSGERADAPRSAGLGVVGLAIGAVSAVVGIGGGSMTVPLLIWLGVAPVRAIGTSAACGVAIAVASATGYALFGPGSASAAMPSGSIGYVFLPAAAGIAIASVALAPYGTRLAHRLGGPTLRRLFAVLLVMVSFSLVAR
jgi:uncharacterized protein